MKFKQYFTFSCSFIPWQHYGEDETFGLHNFKMNAMSTDIYNKN